MKQGKAIVVLLLLAYAFADMSTKFVVTSEYPNSVSLLGGNFMLYWNTNVTANTIEFAMVATTLGWVALTINPDAVSGMQNGDTMIG
jgi:hypothetical protein